MKLNIGKIFAVALLFVTPFAVSQHKACAESIHSNNCSAAPSGTQKDFSSSENLPAEVHKKIVDIAGEKFAGSWLSQEGNEPEQLNIALTAPIRQSTLPKTKIKIKMVPAVYNLATLQAVQDQVAKLMLEPDSKILSVATNVIQNKVEVRALPQNFEAVRRSLLEKNYDANIFKLETSGAIYYGAPIESAPSKY